VDQAWKTIGLKMCSVAPKESRIAKKIIFLSVQNAQLALSLSSPRTLFLPLKAKFTIKAAFDVRFVILLRYLIVLDLIIFKK